MRWLPYGLLLAGLILVGWTVRYLLNWEKNQISERLHACVEAIQERRKADVVAFFDPSIRFRSPVHVVGSGDREALERKLELLWSRIGSFQVIVRNEEISIEGEAARAHWSGNVSFEVPGRGGVGIYQFQVEFSLQEGEAWQVTEIQVPVLKPGLF